MKKKLPGLLIMVILVLAMSVPVFAATTYVVKGTKNYLALRNAPMDLKECEIGQLHNGDYFFAESYTDNGFAYGYTIHGQYGYVKDSYLKKGYQPAQPGYPVYTVVGVKNYLGVRNAPTRDPNAEIGRLYNGQPFQVIQFRTDGFAYGITPDGKYGYVVSSYLR